MLINYFEASEKPELLEGFMAKLVSEIIVEKGLNQSTMTEDENQELGNTITQEWTDGKTQEEMHDILFEKFGSEEEQADYANWKLSI
jgi:hypothetical protein